MKTYLMLLLSFLILGNCTSKKQAIQDIPKPNIILIVADDLGWGDVGFNGQTKIKTPNIDRLAKAGIVFNNFYSGSTVCGPSRASLITGKHTGHSSVRGNPRWTASGKPVDIKDEDITIAEELKRAGGIIGKSMFRRVQSPKSLASSLVDMAVVAKMADGNNSG